MALLENLDKKMKFSLVLSISIIAAAMIFSIASVIVALNFASEERHKVYILDGDIPRTATLTDEDVSIDIEAKAHINRFHELMFTLAPDDKYINHNIEQAMYLTDESGLMQHNTLKEKGFYNNIIASSTMFSILTDSISFDKNTMHFRYVGRQRIERKTAILYRQLVTEGSVIKTARTENNPHGLLITNYRTVENRDLDYKTKNNY